MEQLKQLQTELLIAQARVEELTDARNAEVRRLVSEGGRGTPTRVAEALGISPQRIRQIVEAGS